MPLRGEQLSLLGEVLSYQIENPPTLGEQIITSSGAATVTRLEPVGKTLICWADYGSGIAQPHEIESLIEPVKIVLGGCSCWVEMIESNLHQPNSSHACGWIGWKETKRERKNRDPWICRQAWLYWEEPGGKKRSRYIPKDKLALVEESVYGLRRPIQETLEIVGKKGDESQRNYG